MDVVTAILITFFSCPILTGVTVGWDLEGERDIELRNRTRAIQTHFLPTTGVYVHFVTIEFDQTEDLLLYLLPSDALVDAASHPFVN